MEADEFIQLVQGNFLGYDRKHLTEEDILEAITAILNTLSEMLQPQHRQQLATFLPPSFDQYVMPTATHYHKSLNEFFVKVAEREKTPLPYAIHHSRTVIAVLQETVPADIVQSVREELPSEFSSLFQSSMTMSA